MALEETIKDAGNNSTPRPRPAAGSRYQARADSSCELTILHHSLITDLPETTSMVVISSEGAISVWWFRLGTQPGDSLQTRGLQDDETNHGCNRSFSVHCVTSLAAFTLPWFPHHHHPVFSRPTDGVASHSPAMHQKRIHQADQGPLMGKSTSPANLRRVGSIAGGATHWIDSEQVNERKDANQTFNLLDVASSVLNGQT